MNVVERAKASADALARWNETDMDPSAVSEICNAGADSIQDLLSIVERLPKDAEGNPVCDGDIVYDFDRYRVFERRVITEAWELDEDGEPECAFGDISDCFPTRAAAEAAREGE